MTPDAVFKRRTIAPDSGCLRQLQANLTPDLRLFRPFHASIRLVPSLWVSFGETPFLTSSSSRVRETNEPYLLTATLPPRCNATR
eukprot:scaffold4964_cov166-Amphora_coffeaeformis.AAC.6